MNARSLLRAAVAAAIAAPACTSMQTLGSTLPFDVEKVMGGAVLPSSGASTLAEAEPVRRGETVEGTVNRGNPRYYRLDLAAGEPLTITLYTQILSSRGRGAGVNPVISILDLNGGKLKSRMEATYETTGTRTFDRERLEYTARRTGPVILRMDCEDCGGSSVRYKVVLQ